MKEMNLNKELPVVIIPDTILLPENNMKLKIGKTTGSEIYSRVAKDDFYGIALAVKEPNSNGLYIESDFYQIGTLIKIENIKEMRDFYQLSVKIIERGKSLSLIKQIIKLSMK